MPPPLILAYHAIGDVPAEQDPDGLVVPVEELRQAITGLKRRGYEFVTAAVFARRMATGRPLGAVCALTFDDGSEDNATVLPGLLEQLDVPATLYVCPGQLGEPHPWLEPQSGVRIMSREQLLETARLPFIEIGSHTIRHADLANADEEEAYREMAESKRVLEDMLGSRSRASRIPTATTRRLARRRPSGRLRERRDLRPARRLAPLRAAARADRAGRLAAAVRAEGARPVQAAGRLTADAPAPQAAGPRLRALAGTPGLGREGFTAAARRRQRIAPAITTRWISFVPS